MLSAGSKHRKKDLDSPIASTVRPDNYRNPGLRFTKLCLATKK